MYQKHEAAHLPRLLYSAENIKKKNKKYFAANNKLRRVLDDKKEVGKAEAMVLMLYVELS